MKKYFIVLLILLSCCLFKTRSNNNLIINNTKDNPCNTESNLDTNINICTDDSCSTCKTSDSINANRTCFICPRCPTSSSGNIVCPTCNQCSSCPITNCNQPRSIFIPRSQGSNTARQLVGWNNYINKTNFGCNYLATTNAFSYSRSFRSERIARYLFGSNILNFAGSQIEDRKPCEILADNFGLSQNFRGSIKIDPVIQNIIFDNQLYLQLDSIYQNLYLKINAPIVHTKWNLNINQISENDNNECQPFPACYMSKDQANATCSIEKALSGNFTFGDMKTPWNFGKFSSQPLTKNGLADIDLILGWNYWQDEYSHLGLYTKLVLPTGNKANSKFIFEPLVGNNQHFEAGFGVSGHLELWNWGPDIALTAYLEGNITHLFKNKQLRSFDFCSNGPLSRYLLLKEFKQTNAGLVYNDSLINAINFNTRPVEVKVPIKGDATAMLGFRSGCWSANLGYNFYGNAQEKLKLINRPNSLDNKKFGIKGTEDVCTLEYETSETEPPVFLSLQNKIPIVSTQSNATICSAGTTDNQIDLEQQQNRITVTSQSSQSGSINSNNVILAHNSSTPNLVSVKDLNLSSGTAAATATHKVFGHINYQLNDPCANYIPFFGLGGEFEVEARACNQQTSLNQWSIWLKGGIIY